MDPGARHVTLADGTTIAYEYLVFALGSDPEYYGLPGVAEHSLVVGNYESARALRDRIEALVHEGAAGADAPHVVVAGAGLTGVEVAGELADEYGNRVRLTIVEAGRRSCPDSTPTWC